MSFLLTLLYLGIKDIRLGLTLPAFISLNVFQLLSEKYQLKAITAVFKLIDYIHDPPSPPYQGGDCTTPTRKVLYSTG
nr:MULTISPECIES: hypothetical protein [unclassified Coleofasciculus]